MSSVTGPASSTAASTATGTGSKSEQAYQQIKDRILGGELVPGYRLVLSGIATEMGFSVVPVREAIRRLEAEGLVHFVRNVGATVAGIDPDLYLHTMQTLSIIEGAATALAAPDISAEELAKARELNNQMREVLGNFDPVRFTALNTELHALLYARCPNPHILDLVHRGWNRLGRMRSSVFRYVPDRAHASVAEHDHLLDLIETHAVAADVEHAARAHRTNTLNAFLAQSHQPPSPI
ncbi:MULTISPECIES: GntR family transcriptional regulator [unclassified Arthrobacter]|uniref:GntR family transcriptional regulator n=1 Tax=unclassified Arthrobacter TaxID=235627 RepID=UPI001E64B0B9|nr:MULTISPECIES: GntR family transcriptional regulator [unclassified Arthrobacter]MCC9144507.1 GntR family transcriptional regulator [Arthrobacter sp. zg-Y919]MDK1275733.1 GntR family transcriptional regulator [Arthrobacter sp. zg.Y919]WIB02900.1 GntR family transcriptional regulator [Arthrobacter sp. zg-Y919]